MNELFFKIRTASLSLQFPVVAWQLSADIQVHYLFGQIMFFKLRFLRLCMNVAKPSHPNFYHN